MFNSLLKEERFYKINLRSLFWNSPLLKYQPSPPIQKSTYSCSPKIIKWVPCGSGRYYQPYVKNRLLTVTSMTVKTKIIFVMNMCNNAAT